MSRKTRREKILSQLRRQARLRDGQEKIAPGESKPSQTRSAEYSLPQITPGEKPAGKELNNLPSLAKTANTTGLINYRYLVSDLRRITILTVLAFLFELAIYYFQEVV
ncbi:hypothetical protein HY345_00575 [Candidatus Microgenomates bacterium]|nr:hypothetical protein [Candidatus Microgenomates bacterium]